MRFVMGGAMLLGMMLGGCSDGACADGAASCNADGDAEVCIDGTWSLQETCDASETCEIEAGVAFCANNAPSDADADADAM